MIKKPPQITFRTRSGEHDTLGRQFLPKFVEFLECGQVDDIDRTRVYYNPFHGCPGCGYGCTHAIPEVISIEKNQIGLEPVQNESRYGGGIREVRDIMEEARPAILEKAKNMGR